MKRTLIGRVAADSGQLLIIDPSHIDRHWKRENEGDILGVRFWGSGIERAVHYLQQKGYTVELTDDRNGFIKVNVQQQVEVIQQELTEFIKMDYDENRVIWCVVDNSSYQETCELTSNAERSGQYKDFLACAFQSGFGDGTYEVYATYRDYGTTIDGEHFEDNRISKVEIILIEN